MSSRCVQCVGAFLQCAALWLVWLLLLKRPELYTVITVDGVALFQGISAGS
jgi:hypothetical protein